MDFKEEALLNLDDTEHKFDHNETRLEDWDGLKIAFAECINCNGFYTYDTDHSKVIGIAGIGLMDKDGNYLLSHQCPGKMESN